MLSIWMGIYLAGGIALLEINPGLVIWTTFTFVLVSLILYKFAWSKIITALDERAERIESNIKAAENLRKEAEKKFEEYQEKIANAKSEAQEILQEAKKDAEILKSDILQKAKNESEEIRRRAQKEINLAKELAVQEIHEYVIGLSLEIAKKIINKNLDMEEHKKLIEDTIQQLNKQN
ncbi:MAG: F0F1 ATP synthase subunit B [Leptonema sp. (in: bacteria)]